MGDESFSFNVTGVPCVKCGSLLIDDRNTIKATKSLGEYSDYEGPLCEVCIRKYAELSLADLNLQTLVDGISFDLKEFKVMVAKIVLDAVGKT